MATVTSKDDTSIAYTQLGAGAPIILVDGALCRRAFGPMGPLSALLAEHFTVFMYDRRGRDESGDTQPYAVAREVEDIDALIQQAGGSALVYGTSSGAALALEAAASGLNIQKLALYEPPFNVDENARQPAREYGKAIQAHIDAGQPGEAVAHFMGYVGTPAEAIAGMRQSPMWPMFEAVGHTLAYDNAILGEAAVPVERAKLVKVPTLVMDGGASIPFIHTAALALTEALPNAEHRTLEGQTHDAAADVVAPVLVEFFQR